MIGFIQNNPLLVFALAFILVLLLLLAIVKASGNTKKPVAKKEETKPEKEEKPSKEEKPKDKNEQKKKTEEKDKLTDEDKQKETKDKEKKETEKKDTEKKDTEKKQEPEKKEDKDKKKKKEDKDKKIEQVFKPEKKEESEEQKKERETKDERELLEKMAFVKTSKTVSKLAKREWIEKPIESEFTTEELIAIDDMIREKEIEDESKKSRHFDKSVRLSNFIKSGDYDSMFVSHISDKRTQINTTRHLNINDNFMEKLYSRTNIALERSGVDISDDNYFSAFDQDGDELAEDLADKREEFAYMIDTSYKDTPLTQLPESEYMDDTINLGSENILVVDTVMNRKNRNNRSKR